MKKSRLLLVLLAAVITLLLVYSPHYRYPFPSHADEWHHITETIKLSAGGYSGQSMGLRLGFHILLLPLSQVTDLVLIYKFFPAIWAVFSVLVVFFTVYLKTNRNFFAAIMAMFFFASIKSNVNITGLWFFTPLAFSIPFIFLYIYFFTEGLEKENKKFILLSLLIMAFLLPIHAISVLFASPFLLIYSLFNLRYIKKEWKFFSSFLIIPIIGVVFYKFMMRISWPNLANNLIQALQFKYGWGKLEISNSPLELYSLIGYILGILGILFILAKKENLKKYLAYLLWPFCISISMIIYKFSGISYLTPYQRNLYYFAISLPLLSALGTDYLFKQIRKGNRKVANIFIATVIFFTFCFYWDIPEQIALYEAIDNNDYQALKFLAVLPKASVVVAPAGISEAIYPVSRHQPVATYYFYGDRYDVEKFFAKDDYRIREEIIKKHKVKYVLSKTEINCGWKLIYSKGGDYIYEVK